MNSKNSILRRGLSFFMAAIALCSSAWAEQTLQPSIFVRYQFDTSEMITQLEQAQGKALDPQAAPARWLDEMGWRKWVREYAQKPFQLTQAMKDQLLAQEKYLKLSFKYQIGDAVWVPAEEGEQPYGFQQARINPRGKITKIIPGEKATYFLVEVAVDNGSQGGMVTRQGKLYNGNTGAVLDYGPNFTMETKTYLYSFNELEKFNAPFRSQAVGSDTGATVDYTHDTKWLAKIDAMKDKIVAENLEIDFTKSPAEIHEAQKKLAIRIFNQFKMNRNAPGGGPLLGDVASGGGVCYTQACVLSHAVHATGEPWGIRALNINGSTVNPMGGHGFIRMMMRGAEEVHVYDLAKDPAGKVIFRGMEITSSTLSYISDPGWADYGVTPDQFALMPTETAINPIPIDANRALYDIIQGKSFEDVVAKYGNKGPFVVQNEFSNSLFNGQHEGEFLAPAGQLTDAAAIEKAFGNDLTNLVNEAKSLKANVLSARGNLRTVKTRILTELVEPKIGALKFPNASPEAVKVLLTEYVFRAIR